MMYLITGQPGNGKSLRAMWMMAEEQQRNAKAHALGEDHKDYEPLRRFFTNVAGATTEENPQAFPWVERLPEHNDWTKLPDGSYVLYDEAHSDGDTPGLERYGKLFPATGKPGESQDPRIRAMSTHRHRGFDLVLVTQWPNKVHHQVRSLVGKHVHMSRAMGLQSAGVLEWNRVQVDPYDERQREKAEEEIWSYPKDLYGRYRSAGQHTSSHRFKLPKKVISGLATLGMTILVMWLLYVFLVPDRPDKEPDQEPQATAAPTRGSLLPGAPQPTPSEPTLALGTGAFEVIRTEPAPTLAGCVATEVHCRCYGTDGYLIDLAPQQCRVLLDQPLPFNIYHPYAAPVGGTAVAGTEQSKRLDNS